MMVGLCFGVLSRDLSLTGLLLELSAFTLLLRASGLLAADASCVMNMLLRSPSCDCGRDSFTSFLGTPRASGGIDLLEGDAAVVAVGSSRCFLPLNGHGMFLGPVRPHRRAVGDCIRYLSEWSTSYLITVLHSMWKRVWRMNSLAGARQTSRLVDEPVDVALGIAHVELT
jgi:hypothetical protein